jgi:hypothetical protein
MVKMKIKKMYYSLDVYYKGNIRKISVPKSVYKKYKDKTPEELFLLKESFKFQEWVNGLSKITD